VAGLKTVEVKKTEMYIKILNFVIKRGLVVVNPELRLKFLSKCKN
jgi:hypothetical protein